MSKIKVLKSNDILSFDLPPQFTEEERKEYFTLPIGKSNIEFKKNTDKGRLYIITRIFYSTKKILFSKSILYRRY